MRKRSSKPLDGNDKKKDAVVDHAANQLTTPETALPTVQKNPAAVQLGRLGGLKGGKARAAKLSAERRADIAKRAAEARWARKRS